MPPKKFMHPRNIYRKPPNFEQLAIAYPEFRKFAQQDLSGRVTISFKDPGALRVLSKCLLHRDFNLTVDIPSNRLAPTIALRLNYLLWIEDILEENSLRNVEVTGIDIGTGASCVYPLIAASRFKWHMLATEIDEDSYQIALKNVEVNNLQNMITIKKVSGDTVLASAVDRDHCYEFCMCNPPFFDSEIELDPTKMSRSQSRPPPHNAPTGSVSELITPGGEIGFIKRMIDDSMELKNLIRVYTVMMGRRNSVKVVEGFLEEAKVCSIGTTEFYQGHTSRWAIAWTYDPHITLRKIQIKYSTKKKSNTPFTLTVQQKVDCVVSRIKEFLSELQVEIKTQENKSDFCAMELIAEKNTWTKQRRSEREHIQNESQKDNNSGTYTQGLPVLIGGMRKGGSTTEHTAEELIHNRQSKSAGEQNKSPQLKRPVEDDCDYDLLKRQKTETAGPSVDFKVEPILVASLVVRPSESNTCVIELSWLGGVGGKNLGHQLLQYIKNRLGVH